MALGGVGLIVGSALPWTVLGPVSTTGIGYGFGLLTLLAGAVALWPATRLLVCQLSPPSALTLWSAAAAGTLSASAASLVALSTRPFDYLIYEPVRQAGPQVGRGANVVIVSGVLVAVGAGLTRFLRDRRLE